jgi:hypothetical protein
MNFIAFCALFLKVQSAALFLKVQGRMSFLKNLMKSGKALLRSVTNGSRKVLRKTGKGLSAVTKRLLKSKRKRTKTRRSRR